MDIYYGYQLPNSDEIEWVRGNHLLCSEWESDDYTATIRCQDVFRNMDTEYYKGLYAPNGKSYYDLAIEVLEAAGEKDYYVDPRLKKLYTKNPIPPCFLQGSITDYSQCLPLCSVTVQSWYDSD